MGKLNNWATVGEPASFRGVTTFSKQFTTPKNKVEEFLQGRDGYTMLRQPRRLFPRRKTIATTINSQWQG